MKYQKLHDHNNQGKLKKFDISNKDIFLTMYCILILTPPHHGKIIIFYSLNVTIHMNHRLLDTEKIHQNNLLRCTWLVTGRIQIV